MRAALTALLLAASLSLAGGARLPASPSVPQHDALSAACDGPAVPMLGRRAGEPDRPGLAVALAQLDPHASGLTARCVTRASGLPAPRTPRRPPVAVSPQSPRAPPSAA